MSEGLASERGRKTVVREWVRSVGRCRGVVTKRPGVYGLLEQRGGDGHVRVGWYGGRLHTRRTIRPYLRVSL